MRNNIENIAVEMGEGVVTRAPRTISSQGLGSCVAITLYDTQRKIGGLAHIMLPNSSGLPNESNADCGLRIADLKEEEKDSAFRDQIFHSAETAIPCLLERLHNSGAMRQNIVAKMVGGARMFSHYENGAPPSIGEQNIMSIKEILRREGIPLIGVDIAGHHGRNVEFHLESGKVIVRAIGKDQKEI